jgi:hypothetical protein
MRRFTVMGFTEAELGFVIAAVFAALSVSVISDRVPSPDLVAENYRLATQRDSVARAFAAFKDSARKRSNKVPRCAEKGESAEPVADLRILGRDSYELAGQRLNSAGVARQLDSLVARSRTLECRYLVRTHATAGVDGPDHSAAVRRLWALFDIDERDR